MSREVERWVTLSGRRIPIFKKDAVKPINKEKLKKEIYKDGQGMYMLDLPKGYSTSYGTDYIQAKTRKDVLYELENFVSPDGAVQQTIKGFKKPEKRKYEKVYKDLGLGQLELAGYKTKDANIELYDYEFTRYGNKRDYIVPKLKELGKASRFETLKEAKEAINKEFKKRYKMKNSNM